MTYSLSNNCTTNYYNRTFTVQVIVEDVVTWIFLKHSVYIVEHSDMDIKIKALLFVDRSQQLLQWLDATDCVQKLGCKLFRHVS